MTSTQRQSNNRIVVGVDGSNSSSAALEWAGRQAEVTGSVLELVTAWEWPTTYGAPFTFTPEWNPAADLSLIHIWMTGSGTSFQLFDPGPSYTSAFIIVLLVSVNVSFHLGAVALVLLGPKVIRHSGTTCLRGGRARGWLSMEGAAID